MKIAILAHNKFPICEPYAGGLEMITHLLVKNLSSRGHTVHLYALEGSDSSLHVVPFESIRCENPEITEESENSHMYSKAIRQIENGNYDLVHNHSMNDLPIMWAANTPLKIITSFHTPVFESIHKGLENCTFTPNQTFTTVSKSLGKLYAEHLTNYEVVYNGIDVSKWRFSITPIKNQVCWLGRICKEKAPDSAIRMALKAGKNIVLAGPESDPEYFKTHVEEFLGHPQVTYLGHLNHSEINKIIRESEATLFTSTWKEPYGLVIAESLACGTPVISWDIGAASEILTFKTGFLIPAFDEDIFIESISNIGSLSRRDCRKRAESFCDVSKMVNRYEALYKKLATANRFSKKIAV
ncbi:glycosyltransferase family 4 protein [Gramella sp. BOM4]|nr:glycosyltransferase family 4 protein [Christiangramia bathymodioli]